MRFAHNRTGGSHELLAVAVFLIAGAGSLHAADRPKLYIEPIAGLTTVRHVAPDAITVPVGTALKLSLELPPETGRPPTEVSNPDPGTDTGPTAAVPRDPIQWFGVVESERTEALSRAELVVDGEDEYVIEASVDNDDGTKTRWTVGVRGLAVATDRIGLRRAVPQVDEVHLNEESTNFETMAVYFSGQSIAPLVPVVAARAGGSRGGKAALSRYRTSIDRIIRFDLLTDPPGFESLMEVREPGATAYLAKSNPQRFTEPGVHRISVGPPRMARELEFETYEVVITSHTSGVDIIPEREPVTFQAVTVPPGYESEINWVSSTKFGTARPVTGRGPIFTTRFNDAWGSSYNQPEILMQWLGVKADNATFGQDASCPADTCFFINDWKKEKEGGTPAAPAGWVSLPGSGTAQVDINWLYCWDNGSDPFNLGESVCGLVGCFNDFLTAAEKTAIVNACQNEATTLAKALCAGLQVRATLAADPANVCRHHAIALESVLETLGIGAGLECGMKNGTGHAWTEISVGGVQYHLDSFNAIYVCAGS